MGEANLERPSTPQRGRPFRILMVPNIDDRELAAGTLREARLVLADLILVAYVHGGSPALEETRRELEAEIRRLEQALDDWDARE